MTIDKTKLTELDAVEILYDILTKLRVDPDNARSRRVFASVIKNNIPVWSAIKTVPACAFYIAESNYLVTKFSATTKLSIALYLYHRYDTATLSSDDILAPMINRVRQAVNSIKGPAIVSSSVSSAKRDGGSIHPYTVAELTIDIEYIEALDC